MTIEIEDRSRAIDLLKQYDGGNPYLLNLKKEVIITKKKELNDFNVEYVLKNFDKEPKLIKKIVKITDWYAENLQKEWNTDFLPKKIEIKYLLGETENTYHCLIKYRQCL